jgi:hypothetical protein
MMKVVRSDVKTSGIVPGEMNRRSWRFRLRQGPFCVLQ